MIQGHAPRPRHTCRDSTDLILYQNRLSFLPFRLFFVYCVRNVGVSFGENEVAQCSENIRSLIGNQPQLSNANVGRSLHRRLDTSNGPDMEIMYISR